MFWTTEKSPYQNSCRPTRISKPSLWLAGSTAPDKPHYSDFIINAMVSQTIDVSIVGWAICSGADQRKHQSSALLAFVLGIHRWPVNSLHKGPVTRKMFPFDDVIMRRHLKKSLPPNTDGLFSSWRLKWNRLMFRLVFIVRWHKYM